MLVPNKFSILTLEDARVLKSGIEALVGIPKEKVYGRYLSDKQLSKLKDLGILDIYHQLGEFVYDNNHWEALKGLDPDRVVHKKDLYDDR
jgi:hypothetical protein